MVTVGEIIQRVQSLYSKGVESDDSRLSSRHIYSKFLSSRSTVLEQKINKKQSISAWDFQTLEGVELIEVGGHRLPCLPQVGCKLVRSKYKLPRPILALYNNGIKQVYTIDRGEDIDKTTLNSYKYLRGNKYSKKKMSYFIEDGYLYLSAPSPVRVLTIVGLFDDPVEADSFKTYCEDCEECEDCVSMLDKTFPIGGRTLEAVLQFCKEEFLGQFTQMKEDRNSNINDD